MPSVKSTREQETEGQVLRPANRELIAMGDEMGLESVVTRSGPTERIAVAIKMRYVDQLDGAPFR